MNAPELWARHEWGTAMSEARRLTIGSSMRRVAWGVGAACVVAAFLLLPMVGRNVEANGPGGAATPMPLMVLQGAPTPAPVVGPRLEPAPIPHTDVLLPLVIQAELLSPLPRSAQEANAAADAIREAEEADGRGITTGTSPIASGITLFAPRTVFQVTYLAAPVAARVQPVGAAAVGPAPGTVWQPPAQAVAAPGSVVLLPAQAAVPQPVATPVGALLTIPSPARLGLPTPVPTPIAVPTIGIRDPSVPFAVQAPYLIPVVSKATVSLSAQVQFAPVAAAPLPEAAPGIPSAHDVPVIVVEPGGASVPIAQGATMQIVGVDIACNNFNQASRWASRRDASPTDMWSDWYAGWGPFAVDSGLYQAKNVTFSQEQAVGPGSNAGPNEHSAKIASNQPYAAGFGSPLFGVPPGAVITVRVNYLIFDHNDHGYDYDWASLGIKPDAYDDEARYVNGYVRGQWATLTNSVVAGANGRIMVLIQAESPAALNSNIYFDNVRIWIDGAPVVDCAG